MPAGKGGVAEGIELAAVSVDTGLLDDGRGWVPEVAVNRYLSGV